MGTSCSGCIEIFGWNCEPGEEDEDEPWVTVVIISPFLFYRHYPLFCRLFGIRCEADDDGPPAVAPRRGMPQHASWEALRHLERSYDVSWATPREVETAIEGLDLSGHWGLQYVLDSLRVFGERFGNDRVRLVIGFSS